MLSYQNCVFCVTAVGIWLREVGSQVIPTAKAHFVGLFAEHLRLETDKIVAMTPSVDAFISDDVFLQPMAKKHLLQWKNRARFSENVLAMHELQGNVRQAYVDFGVVPSDALAHSTAGPILSEGCRFLT